MALADRRRAPAPALAPAATWLDQLAVREAAAARGSVAAEATLVAWVGRVLMGLTVYVLIVGLNPMQHGTADATSGSPLRQAAFLGLGVLAAPLALARWRMSAAILARAWPLLLVFAALAATTLWSQFPEATVRRLAVLSVVVVVGLALAAALPRPRAFLVPFATFFAAVLLTDLILAVVMPGRAYDALGLAALHPSKNVAGAVGQVMAITFAACAVGTRNPAGFWASVVLVLLTLLFLVLTQSKAALALTVLATFGLLPVLALASRSTAMAGLLGGGVLLGAGGIIFATGALGLTGADWAVITTGDATFTGRDQIWAASLAQIEKRPWLGYGFGAVWSMLPDFSPLTGHIGFWTDNPATLREINQSHNGYLDIALHGGLLLGAVVALFVVATLTTAVRALGRPDADRWQVAANAFFGTFFVALLVANLLESTMFFPDGLLGQVMILTVLAQCAWRVPAKLR